MPKISFNWKAVLAAAALAAFAGACSSPAVTGMKVHIQNQDYISAVQLADSMIAKGDSLDAEIWYWRGNALTQINRWNDASESFSRVAELGESETYAIEEYWFVFFNSAASILNEGDIEHAARVLEKGAEIAPKRPDFDLMLGDIELSVNDDPEAALDRFVAASGKARALIDETQRMIEDSSDPYQLDYLTQSLNQVEEILIHSLYNSGSILTVMAIDAEGEETAGYLTQARESYEEALEADPGNADVLEALANVYLIEGNLEAALEIYDTALDNIQEGVAEGWMDREEADRLASGILISKGYAYIEMEEYESAIAELNRAGDLVGADFTILSSLAHANFVMGSYDRALSALESVFEIPGLTADQLADAYYIQYACFNMKEMDEAAARAMETAIQYRGDNADYWRYLASTYSRLGRRTDAIEAMERAEELMGGR